MAEAMLDENNILQTLTTDLIDQLTPIFPQLEAAVLRRCCDIVLGRLAPEQRILANVITDCINQLLDDPPLADPDDHPVAGPGDQPVADIYGALPAYAHNVADQYAPTATGPDVAMVPHNHQPGMMDHVINIAPNNFLGGLLPTEMPAPVMGLDNAGEVYPDLLNRASTSSMSSTASNNSSYMNMPLPSIPGVTTPLNPHAPSFLPRSVNEVDADTPQSFLKTQGRTQSRSSSADCIDLTFSPRPLGHIDTNRDTASEESVTITEPMPEKSHDEKIKEMTTQVICIFSDACPTFIHTKLEEAFAASQDPVAFTCEYMLTNLDYPRKPKAGKNTSRSNSTTSSTMTRDYLTDYSSVTSHDYRLQCVNVLRFDFRKVAVQTLNKVLALHGHHYAPTWYCIVECLRKNKIPIAMGPVSSTNDKENIYPKIIEIKSHPSSETIFIEKAYNSEVPLKSPIVMKLLKCGRPVGVGRPILLTEDLRKEVIFIRDKMASESQLEDIAMATSINETEYNDSGQMIECGCCFGEYVFDKMVQCYEGHLFCSACLINYTKEAVYGQGRLNLGCMTDGCEETYPQGEFQRVLSKDLFAKYEDRSKEENLNLAELEDLVRCPSCNYGAVLDKGMKVFSCEDCGKETCRHCKEDWAEHFGIPCSELEKKDETKVRLAFEERMTTAKIRSCERCKAGFTKSDGCNKMTCRCGHTMCYICRKPKIDYNHFCQHVREPKQSCKKCSACSLWTNPEEDDDRAISEIKKEAEEKQVSAHTAKHGIGVPDEIPNKRQRLY